MQSEKSFNVFLWASETIPTTCLLSSYWTIFGVASMLKQSLYIYGKTEKYEYWKRAREIDDDLCIEQELTLCTLSLWLTTSSPQIATYPKGCLD